MKEKPADKIKKGLNKNLVRQISLMKDEPDWMLDLRLKALEIFLQKSLPSWGPNLAQVPFDKIRYYVPPVAPKADDWSKVPRQIRDVYDKIGIPKAERNFLAGVESQYDSEAVYGSLKKYLADKGVIFSDMDSALRDYPALVKRYFGKLIYPDDHKLAALNTAVWSGGSFVYIPAGVKVDLPLQAYFHINTRKMGQFERTLIIAEEGSQVSYLEGCSAPVYSTSSLHAANVEIFVGDHARVTYTTIQNWSTNVFNLVTKRALVKEGAQMRWIDCNLGSRVTMKYPSCILTGRKAKAELLSMAYAGKGQWQDTGGKMIHVAPETSSLMMSKSLSQYGGRVSYRGMVKVAAGAFKSKAHTQCNSLILDDKSKADTYPTMEIGENDVEATHEATSGKIQDDQLYYLMSRGISEEQARTMVVAGFVEPIVRSLPLEYAVEMNRLIELEMEGSVG